MSSINTTLTTSGNSAAVRLPKDLLRLSGLSGRVQLDVQEGKIIISKPADPRQGWAEQIKTLVAAQGDPTLEFNDMGSAAQDGLQDLPWDGTSFQKRPKGNARLS